ncbi:glycosyltransferase family 15 protein [Auriscalpium vulgare]|uniref:Glycosyltransferase family 15 protein n=1 Tax=Auriscalpium vulgare TaxID=40419 RepID=A0ACB8SD51_9AGAM|nr:glycosyltransferase family 15 protein [Auriscalpium vulgare]
MGYITTTARCLCLAVAFSLCLISLRYATPGNIINERFSIPSSRTDRANATFLVICQNEDLSKVLRSVQQMEDRFNERFGYPWAFLNDEPFTEDFMSRVRAMTKAQVSFGVIEKEQWEQPEWINKTKAAHLRKSMFLSRVPFGGSVRHRSLYRFSSGFLSKHPMLDRYQYYWRLEPGSQYPCNILYDPFKFMQKENKTYGFNLATREVEQTIPTLWETVYDFMTDNADLAADSNAMGFLTDDEGDSYNLCHYESSFEILDMTFLRRDAYTQYFQYLDRKGGFFYERWGSAPVLSIALSLFLDKDQTHFFDDIGFRHEELQHCPNGDAHARARCSCDPEDNFDRDKQSCLGRWEALRVNVSL